MANSAKNTGAPAYRRNRYAAPIGGIFIVLAAIGLITIVIVCIRFTQGLLDDSKEKEAFEKTILPVVMFDPVPFENATDIDPLFLLCSSLWDTLLGDKRSSYQYDHIGRMMVPASDIDTHAAKLFGPDITLQHQSFSYVENNYVYEDSTKTYYIPTSGEVNFYTPEVERVVKEGDTFTLTVGYLAPLNMFTQIMTSESGERLPEKYMLYELKRVKDHYQLIAVRDIPRDNPLYPIGAIPGMPMEGTGVS